MVNRRWDIVPCIVRKHFLPNFFFEYLRAESHNNKVLPGLWVMLSSDRSSVLYIVPALPAPCDKPINRFNLCTVPEKLTTLQAGTQKVGGKKKNFRPDQNALLSERFFGQKLTFWPAFFKNIICIWFCPRLCKKSQSFVNFKGIKLALKNLGRFSSPTASRAVLRG